MRSCIPAFLPLVFVTFPLLVLSPSCSLLTDYFEWVRDDEDEPLPGATLLWGDEFDGTKLDENKWAYRGLGPRRDGVNVREAVQLDGNGHLLMTTSYVDGAYHTGMIGTESTFMHTFGYWEARMRFQKQEGHWSAFWLQSPTISLVGDPAVNGTEIDIIEYLKIKGDVVLHNLHWDGYDDAHKHVGKRIPFPGLGEGFHTIAVDWTPDAYTFYVDGIETWHTTRAVSKRDQYAILSLEVGDWAGDIRRATLPDTLIVDYVRVYDRKP
jgi:beta-glucanase (GH16 family)